MTPCSARIGITLAGTRQPRSRRRRIEYPTQARPARAMAQVEGSGTGATVVVRAGEQKFVRPKFTTESTPPRCRFRPPST